ATIQDTVLERSQYTRVNGKDTVILSIQKAREGNAVEIAEEAEKRIAEIQERYPDLQIVKTFEQARMISESLADLNFTLYFAIILVAGVVYMFLHNFRGTLIVAIAIPTCIFVALIAVSLAGFTINNMTMLALILAVAVLVDDAIVVLENIYRHLQMGEDPREAAINGRGEIGLAAIAITMADVVVFLPIAFMGGIVGQFFKPMALTYVFAVLASIFVSFTVTPMLAARWYRKGEDVEHGKGRFSQWFERSFGRVERAYRAALEWSLNHRWFVFTLGNLLLVAIFMFIGGGFAGLSGDPMSAIRPGPDGSSGPMKLMFFAVIVGFVVFVINVLRTWRRPHRSLFANFVRFVGAGFAFGLIFPAAALAGAYFGAWKKEAPFKFEFIPQSDGGMVNVSIELPPGSSLEATQRVVERVEGVLGQHPDVKYVVSTLGSTSGGFGGGGSRGSNFAQVRGSLYEKAAPMDLLPFKKHEERLRWDRDNKISADIIESIGRLPGAEIKVSASGGQGFGAPIQMSFRGDDREKIIRTAERVRNRLLEGAVDGVINPDLSTTAGKPELQAIPDPVRLADAGLTVAEVGAAMRTLYQGNDLAKLRQLGEEYPIRVQLSPEDKNNPNLVNEVPIAFKQGNPVYLNSVGRIEERPSVDKVERRDRQVEVRLSADLLPNFASGSVQAQVDRLIEEEKLLESGVAVAPQGQAQAQAREQGYLFGAFLLGLVLVYMLLASLYDNLLYPLIIQLAQPQALTGAILALVLTDKSLNLVGFIGLITLTGLVGKNAILLVDYTNTLRARGRSRHDAIVEAGPVRLRPIAMTTIALILGVLPIAIALGRGSEFRETIGIVIIGGMILSTVMTLLVIPCSYTIFDDASIGLGRLMRRLRGERDLPPPAHPVEPASLLESPEQPEEEAEIRV
ncbi:MAG TPA: efflux RND transporter permease subunit, partial [Fimbriimonadaceae bacterium]|nr:efflux RND transporter permease subunit [Fimbriimonadaceae bacterium]